MTTRYAHIEPVTTRTAMSALPPLATVYEDSAAKPTAANGTG